MDISQLLHAAKRSSAAGPPAQQVNNTSLLATVLLRKQAELDRQSALIAHRLAALQAPAPALTPSDDIILTLLQRQRQLEALQQVIRSSSSSSEVQTLNILGGPASLSFHSNLTAPRQPAPKLDALADIICARGAKVPSETTAGPYPPQVVDATSMLPYRKRKGRTGSFPQKLHQILADLQLQPGGSEIASFLPHGRAFMIHKPREFAQHVLPKYFRMSHYSSFQRQLNLYEFRRVSGGPDKGAYCHESFIQNRPQLSVMMKRNKIKGIKSSDDHLHAEDGSHAEEGDETAGLQDKKG